MVFKGLMTAATAVALITAPTVAAAQGAAATARALQPAEETVEGSELRGGWFIPLAAVILVILGIVVLVSDDDDEDRVSP